MTPEQKKFASEMSDEILKKALFDVKNLWGEEFLVQLNMNISKIEITKVSFDSEKKAMA